MFWARTTQREWLFEDFEQIERYFPGAELVEAISTPFDITVRPRPAKKTRYGGRRKASRRTPAADAMAPGNASLSLETVPAEPSLCTGGLL